MHSKQIMQAAIEGNHKEKQNRLAPWVNKVKGKVTTSPDIKFEENRIRVLNVIEKPYLISSTAEFLNKIES